MGKLAGFVARVKVLATEAVTYLVVAGAAIPLALVEVDKYLPQGWQDKAATIGGSAVSVIGVAVAILRMVTKVPAEQRGLLSPAAPAPIPAAPAPTSIAVGQDSQPNAGVIPGLEP